MSTAKQPSLPKQLYDALCEVTDVYWGVDDAKNGDGGQPPACIRQARAAIRRYRAQKARQSLKPQRAA